MLNDCTLMEKKNSKLPYYNTKMLNSLSSAWWKKFRTSVNELLNERHEESPNDFVIKFKNQ